MKTISVLLLGAAASMALTASPSLIGSTTTINYLYPTTAAVYATQTVTVTSGVEVTCPGGLAGTGVCVPFAEAATIDIGANSITIMEAAGTSYTAGAFNGLQFTGLDFGSGTSLSGFTLTTDLPGLVASDVSFTGNYIEYNAEGLSFANAPYTITLNLATTTLAASTPEPATVGLFGLATAALGLWGLRRKRVFQKA